MSETTDPGEVQSAHIPAADTNGQLIVSLAIVGTMGAISVGLIVAAIWTKDWSVAMGGVGTAIGSLATALNAPTGISNALRAAKPPTT